MASPGLMTVPTLGRPIARYVPVGGVTDFTVTALSPLLTMSVICGSEIPTGTLSISSPSFSLMLNAMAGLVANSPVWVPLPTRGTETGTADPAVVNDTVPSAPPTVPGANFTAARSSSPLCSVTGKAALAVVPSGWVTVTWPRVNGAGLVPALTVAPVTVTVLVAVSATCLTADAPTAVSLN